MIPDAAVEAAAKAVAIGMWGRYDPDDVPYYLNAVREILEAAAPHMLNLAKREAWDANLEIQRLRAELAKFEALRPYTIEDQRKHGETW